MTRNFKQPRRDDERPNSRRYSGRYEGEQSPRPARPRLNRASVDRAWENGAPQQHHDYRARGTYNPRNTRGTQPRQEGRPYRANRGQYSPNDSPSAPNGRNYRKPPFQRQENRHFDDRQPRRYSGSRPYGSGQRTFDERPYRERPRFSPGGERGERRSSYREQERNTRSRPYPPRRDAERDQAPRDYNRPNRYGRTGAPDRQYRQGERRPDARDTRNPRFESRPERFSRSAYRPPTYSVDHKGEELFEGDYERFNAGENTPHSHERHVTQLPDGRVLKGSRRDQREAAAFWTDVDQETQELVPQVEPDYLPGDEKEDVPAKRPVTRKKVDGRTARSRTPEASEAPKATRATGKRTAGSDGESRPKKSSRAVANASKLAQETGGASRVKKSPAKPKSKKAPEDNTRPSRRGYKWPKPE